MRPTMVLVFELSMLLGGVTTLVEANAFLARVQPQDAKSALSAESEHALILALERELGSGHRHTSEKRLKRLEQMLSPMFGAMTKNENGKLGAAAAGYVLHRVFVQR